MIEGSCLCGKIRYASEGEITEMAMCHCSQCRKAQGSAFATNCPVADDKLSFTGIGHIKEFQSSEGKVRAFCSNCGSPLYSAKQALPNVKRLRIGTVDNAFVCENKYHIYSASKAKWHSISDAFTQYTKNKNT